MKTNLKNTTFLLPYLATQIHTSLSNNIQEHFIQHFLRFINKTTTNITEDKSILFKLKHQLINLNNETDEMFNECAVIMQHVEQFVAKSLKRYKRYVEAIAKDLLANETINYERILELVPKKLENILEISYDESAKYPVVYGRDVS